MFVCNKQMANMVPSIIVCGAFHFRGKSQLVIVEGPMNQQVYRRVLKQNLLFWAMGTFRNNSTQGTGHYHFSRKSGHEGHGLDIISFVRGIQR